MGAAATVHPNTEWKVLHPHPHHFCQQLSEQILNGTSAQLGYTVPFTLDVLENTRKYTNYKCLHKIHRLNTTKKKQTTQNTAKQNYSGSVTSYNNQSGNAIGLFYNDPEPTHFFLLLLLWYCWSVFWPVKLSRR